MAQNSLLAEFVNEHPGELQRRLTEAFDAKLTEDEDSAIESLLTELVEILQQRVAMVEQGDSNASTAD